VINGVPTAAIMFVTVSFCIKQTRHRAGTPQILLRRSSKRRTISAFVYGRMRGADMVRLSFAHRSAELAFVRPL